MIRPTPEQLATLARFERLAFELCDRVNRTPAVKRVAHGFLKHVAATWIHHATSNLTYVHGLEQVAALRPDRGVVVASNHLSFFDLYVISSRLLRDTTWIRRMYFPVRGDYFYERPDGVLVNALMSALAMYPPVMRQGDKRAFNQFTVDVLAELIAEPGTVVGIHPEGTRNKSGDPYTLLPAQPGIGQIVYQARPIVLPMFIQGLGNDLPRQVLGNFNGTGAPITLVMGAPLNLDRFYSDAPRLRTYKRLADHIRAEITVLGERERALRVQWGLPALAPPPAPGRRAA